MYKHSWAVALAVVAMGSTGAADIINVSSGGSIQNAINSASNGDEIVVAPGTYNEAIDFLGKAITLRSSGGADITTIDATGLNATVVQCVNGEGADTVLEGFTVTGGTNGGMFNSLSGPTVIGCVFRGNIAVLGGGMHNVGNRTTVVNCVFSGNYAFFVGGGMYNDVHDTDVMVINCTFSNNEPAGIYNEIGATGTVTNCIVWGSPNAIFGDPPTVAYSNVEGGFPGVGNIDIDPLFARIPDPGPDITWGTADDDYGDLHLTDGSPCIDAGDNTAVPVAVSTDVDGKPRFVDDPDTPDTGSGTPPIVDMGAYEIQPCLTDVNDDGSTDVLDLIDLLLCFGQPATPPCDTGQDVNSDGTVNVLDLIDLLLVFGTACP
ncbi:MAG: choice-of-anchor Q domain-containing protein [Planctomycetota bacterium]|jgi:hypothetical protein